MVNETPFQGFSSRRGLAKPNSRAALPEEKNTDENEALPCAEKMAFDSKKEAEAVGVAAEWQHGGALKAYQCHHCQLWHLSSS
jgi:hypothetical protein